MPKLLLPVSRWLLGPRTRGWFFQGPLRVFLGFALEGPGVSLEGHDSKGGRGQSHWRQVEAVGL